ncbi:hypothetical protein C0993_000265 [Termitomyces sp. T159_Od127]|nr:hypothetical protein C0993_000265 [Termitomyces sp. T159_Od127]
MVALTADAQEAPKENRDDSVIAEAVNDQPKINSSQTRNGHPTHKKQPHNDVDPEAQQLVIDSLRSQVQDLFSQVSELNNKLVKSYDRVSDLEDDLHAASEANRSSSLKIAQLESEREQHLSALTTGILVEKSQVTAELTRLMEKATEEAAQRGQAESARQAIEKDLDDLSATLFGQANTMVAEARLARHESEQKVEAAERNLKIAEEAVSAMQQQIQMLRAKKEEAERLAEVSQEALNVTIGKGINKPLSKNPTQSLRLLSSHSPYQEFLLFVAHLRSVHSSSSQPPVISSLLPLPFLARILTEDSEPTIRFDLAPSLNWLSRRSVLAAIHNGQLIIEPMSSIAFLQEVNSYGSVMTGSISCALCGASIFSTPTSSSNTTLPLPPVLTHSNSGSTSWSASLFKKPPTNNHLFATNNSPPSTPTSSRKASLDQVSPSQVYIFKLATSSIPRTSSSSLSSSPLPTHTDNRVFNTSSTNSQQPSTIYPLCKNNWCLYRLRSTCSLWAFVRSGVVEKIWEEEVPIIPTQAASTVGEKPPIPPRRRGLWSMASALSERAVSWGEGDKDKVKRTKAAEKISSSAPPALEPKSARRRLPPPLPQKGTPATTTPVASMPAKPVVPPPLPKRSEVRQASPSSAPASVEKPVGTSEAATAGDLANASSRAPLLSTEVLKESLAAALASDAQAKTPTASTTDPTPPEDSTATVTTPVTHTTPADTTVTAPQEPKLPPRPPRRPMNPDSRPQTPPVASGSPPPPDNLTPPPLPRRAATRASRMLADSEMPSRPSTPAEQNKEPNSEDVDQLPKEQNPEQAILSTTAAVPPVEESAKEERLVERPAVMSPSVEEEVFVDAESGSESGKEGVKAEKELEGRGKVSLPQDDSEVKEEADEVDKSNNVEEKSGNVEEELDKVEEKAEKKDEGVTNNVGEIMEKTEFKTTGEEKAETQTDEKIEKNAETSLTKAEVVVTSSNVQATNQKDAEKDTDDCKKSSEDDLSGSYVGDTTWEERTWKEIIRLKEAMFWARIGGLKQ